MNGKLRDTVKEGQHHIDLLQMKSIYFDQQMELIVVEKMVVEERMTDVTLNLTGLCRKIQLCLSGWRV